MKKILLLVTGVFILQSCIETPEIITPEDGEQLTCEWNCGCHWVNGSGVGSDLSCFYVTEEICANPERFFNDVRQEMETSNWGDDSVYDAGDGGVAFHGLWNWGDNVTTGMGWTGWWKAYAKHCEDNGYFTSNYSNIRYGETGADGSINRLVVIKTDRDGDFMGELLGKRQHDYISIRGTRELTRKKITSPTFNSPFIYFENQPEGMIEISIDSEWDTFTSVTPPFNNSHGWNIKSDGDTVNVDGKETDNLFYELAVKKIQLSRNGENFSSKDELIDFLYNSEFFDKMGFTQQQKEDSLGYIIPKIEQANNYYLTILDPESIDTISQLTINPKPDNLLRRYFAIYPTNLPVGTDGGLNYPEHQNTQGYTVIENGEFYIDDEMFVLWR